MVKFIYDYELVECSDDYQETLAFCCEIQDIESLDMIREQLNNQDITGAMFLTENGDIMDQLHVRYGYPTFRYSKQWYKVTERVIDLQHYEIKRNGEFYTAYNLRHI